MAAKLFGLDFEIKDLDKTIAERLRDYPYARIIESLPQFGPNLGAVFLVVIRGDPASFTMAGRSASYAGVFLCQADSGRACGKLRRPKRSNGGLRRAFYLAALSSLRTGGPSRQFYDRECIERLVHGQALLALARAPSTYCGPCHATGESSPQSSP
ncbi:transposase [Mycobacterium sp. MUNTM1]